MIIKLTIETDDNPEDCMESVKMNLQYVTDTIGFMFPDNAGTGGNMRFRTQAGDTVHLEVTP